MAGKTNTLKVRRIDLLEMLEERYVQMTKQKEAYQKAEAASYVAVQLAEKSIGLEAVVGGVVMSIITE